MRVTCKGESRGANGVLVEKLEEKRKRGRPMSGRQDGILERLKKRDNVEDLGVDGRMALKLISYKWDGGMKWIDLAQGYGQITDPCKCGNESPISNDCRWV